MRASDISEEDIFKMGEAICIRDKIIGVLVVTIIIIMFIGAYLTWKQEQKIDRMDH